MLNFQYILEHELTVPQVVRDNVRMVHIDETHRRALFAARLATALRGAGIQEHGSSALLGRLTGTTTKGANKWVNGESVPRKANLEAIADRLGVRAEWLEYGIGSMKADGNVEVAANYRSRRRAPVISRVQAGAWEECTDPLPPGVGDSWEDVPDTASANCFWLRVVGDSMTSTAGVSVPEGCMILVDPEVSADNGKLIVAKLIDSDEATFKRLIIDGGRKYLKALNPAYPVIEINSNCRIVGVVIEARQRL